MCGFFCIIQSKKKFNQSLFKKSLRLQKHRGPDEDGIKKIQLDKNKVCILGHQRLSILDQRFGSQPMKSSVKKNWILFNGEIYNNKLLRNKLHKKYNFLSSHSDTESALAHYTINNLKAFDDFDGMFSILILDILKSKIIISRDRNGIKPLYYFNDGENIGVSTELKSITKYFKPKLIKDNLEFSWMLDMIPSPKSILKDTKQINHGEILEISLDSFKEKNSTFISKSNQNSINLTFENLLKKSIDEQMVADVNVGCLLSGGVDSLLLSCLIAEKYPKTTFFYVDKTNPYEQENVKKFQEMFKVKIERIKPNYNDIEKIFENFKKLDEPFFDTSFLNVMKVCEIARDKHNCKVLLSGDGPDEYLGGYEYFKSYAKWYKRLFLQNNLYNSFLKKIINTHAVNLFSSNLNSRNKAYKFLQEYCSGIDKRFEDLLEKIREERIKNYMSDTVLKKVDIGSMIESVEIRVPYLSNDLTYFMKKKTLKDILKKGHKPYILSVLKRKYSNKFHLNFPKSGFNIIFDKLYEDEKTWIFLKEKLKNSKILKKLCFYTVHKGYKSNQIRSKMLMRIFITLAWEESFEQMYIN